LCRILVMKPQGKKPFRRHAGSHDGMSSKPEFTFCFLVQPFTYFLVQYFYERIPVYIRINKHKCMESGRTAPRFSTSGNGSRYRLDATLGESKRDEKILASPGDRIPIPW
jgi:hypothetical protein